MPRKNLINTKFVILMALLLMSCADSEKDLNSGIVGPVLPNPGNDAGSANIDSDSQWAFIRLEKHKEILDPECKNNIEVFTIQPDGKYLYTSCNGTEGGNLDRRLKSQIGVWAKLSLVSNYKREICAEVSPQAESYLTVTLENGEVVPVYQELKYKGLCSLGDRRAALSLHRTLLNAMKSHAPIANNENFSRTNLDLRPSLR